MKRIAPHEQFHSLAFLEAHYPGGNSGQVFHAGLEQFFPGVGVQHMLQGLAGMAVGVNAGVGHDPGHLVSEQRNVPGIPAVGHRREKSKEPFLSNHSTRTVENLDADVIQVCTSVYRGFGIGLGDKQHFSGARLGANVPGGDFHPFWFARAG